MTTFILINAHIYTFDPAHPQARGMIIENGIIKALLQEDEMDLGSGHAQRENLQGKIVLPGFTDAHIHLKQYALNLKKINCETDTKRECLRRIAERVGETAPETWILGHGWDQNRWEEGYGTREELDKIAPQHPVYLTAKSLHAAWVNTTALAKAHISKHTPDPPGGRLSRDQKGRLTGLLFEKALPLVADHIPQPDVQETTRAMRDAQTTLWEVGLTGVHDFDRHLSFSALQKLVHNNELKLRVTKHINIQKLDSAIEIGLRSGFGNPMLHLGGIKAFADGALGPQTAAMFAPYQGRKDDRGILLLSEEEIVQKGIRAAQHGLNMAIHAIGDRANREVLNAYGRIRAYEKSHQIPPLRHRIEHVQVLDPADRDRLSKMDIIASMQPLHATSDMETATRYWGERTRYAYAWRTLLDHHTPLAFGSDAPVESPNPFLGLHAAVTRRKLNGEPGPKGWIPEQRISLIEAMQAYTSGAAYASGREERSGKLSPGYWADLIVLEKDPFSTPVQELATTRPIATMVNGEWVWQMGA
jgi:predicted amidohydrolase YtcJ